MAALTEAQHTGAFVVSDQNNLSYDKATITGGSFVDGQVLGKKVVGTATAVAGESNTGNGTIGTITLLGNTQPGAYTLTCTGGAKTATSGALVGTGNGTITASPTVGANAKLGTYKAIFVEPATDLGAFLVEDPDGIVIGSGAVGTEFSTGTHLTFTIADGSTDFTAGSYFPITVAASVASNSGVFSVTAPDGTVLGNATVASAFSTGSHLSFTIADGSTDFAVNDSFTITVAIATEKYTGHDPAATDGSQHAVAILKGAVDASSVDAYGAIMARFGEVTGSMLTWKTGISAADKAAGIAKLKTCGIVVR